MVVFRIGEIKSFNDGDVRPAVWRNRPLRLGPDRKKFREEPSEINRSSASNIKPCMISSSKFSLAKKKFHSSKLKETEKNFYFYFVRSNLESV